MREFSIFHLSKLEWDASKIGIKSNGGWAVFTDPVTHKSLNSPRRPYPEPKITYRRKTEEQLEQEEKVRQWREIRTKKKGNNFNNFSTVTNPLLNPPKDNYKEFKARKQLISTKNSNSEFDDTMPYANGALTSRSMPRKPQKTVQLARDLQVTSLNTQRNHCYSRTSVAKCTPRSIASSIQYYKSDEDLNEEEETNYGGDMKLCDNKIKSENEDENIIQNDDEINKAETEILNISMNSASSINSNGSHNETQNEKNHKSTLENLGENEINDNNVEITINNDEDYNESEYNEKDSLNDDVERIEIKADLTSDQTNDSNSLNDETSSKNENEQNEINESIEKNDDNDEIKTELNNNSTIKLWKKKRTGEVISRKRIVITSKISSDNEKKDDSIVEEAQESNENKFNYTHPNDKPIHYNFKYNHPNNLRKSEISYNYNKKQKKEIRINKKSTKIASNNLESIHNNVHNNSEIDYENNKEKSEIEKLDINKKENNNEINNDEQNKNINNENIEIELHNNINKNSDNQNNNNNLNNNVGNEETNDQNQFNEIENSDNTNIDKQSDSTQISNDDQKNSTQIDPPSTTKNKEEEEEQKDSIEITNSDNDNDQINSIDNNNEQTNTITENKNSVKNENIEYENSESFNESFLTNCDSYNGYIESYTTSIASKNTKKASNVYGHNYNDYNYYNNVLTANTKANVASGAPFQFSSTRTGSISSCEISHNLSPLPSTRRPATAIRQRFIERPECIGPERFFKGDDPAPARRFFQSANLVAEMRREEEMKLIKNAQVKRNLSKTVSKKSLSLYERSLKPQEKRYCWPRDFAQFSVE